MTDILQPEVPWGEPIAMDFEEFLLRFLVEAGRSAVIRCFQVHDDVPLGWSLKFAAESIEITIDVWKAMEERELKKLLLDPIAMEFITWEKAR